MGSISGALDAAAMLQGFGPWILLGVAIVIFIETGLLFPFLPGDSLLVTAAALHVQLNVNVWLVALVAAVAAVAGDQLSFWLGRRFGRRLFKPDARVLKTSRLHEAEEFFAKWGPLALVLGRFVPIVRTYVPVAAGTADMHYRKFVGWNVLGALSWVVLMMGVGLALGQIPGITKSIDGIMILVVLVSVMPIVIGALHKKRQQKKNALLDDVEARESVDVQ